MEKKNWSGLKHELKHHGQKELIDVIRDLYRLNSQCKDFLHTRFLPDNQTIEHYKDKIKMFMYPDVINNKKLNISSARKTISAYKNASQDRFGEIELMVCFVEYGTGFTVDYGDIDADFYHSLETMFSQALRKIKTLSKVEERTLEVFLPRLEKVTRRAKNIGWCYYDEISDSLAQFYQHMQISDALISRFQEVQPEKADSISAAEARSKIFEVIKKDGPLRKYQILKRTDVKLSDWNLRIKELLEEGRVRRIGSRRDTVYTLADELNE